MEWSLPWRARVPQLGKIIPWILWNPNWLLGSHQSVTYTCPKPDKSSHALSSYFFKIHFNITLPSMPTSPKWPLSCRFHFQRPVFNFLLRHMYHITHHSHPPILLPRWGTWNMKLLFMEFSRLLLIPAYQVQISFPASYFQTLQLMFFLNIWDRVSHSYKIQGKIIIPCILIFILLDN
jgi:hypothetical protein